MADLSQSPVEFATVSRESRYWPWASRTVSPSGKRGVTVSSRKACHAWSSTISPLSSFRAMYSLYSVNRSVPSAHWRVAVPEQAASVTTADTAPTSAAARIEGLPTVGDPTDSARYARAPHPGTAA